ncbi:hypothetical protein ACSV5M_17355 [Cellvibrio sp. ARAG 10.3]|uniref:hypothetical protein n=1 Tax=Cellvibrio sp. ARAG 10.3 TaxID=3451358 RepID=UPI003F48CAF5
MNLLRTDKEVALNDLLVASRETADHYQDALEYLDDHPITPALRDIMQERLSVIERIEQAIRALGDLPSMPDPDRETGEMLLHHVTAALSSDSATEILEQRIKAERHLLALLKACSDVGLDSDQPQLLQEMAQQVHRVITRLEQLEA